MNKQHKCPGKNDGSLTRPLIDRSWMFSNIRTRPTSQPQMLQIGDDFLMKDFTQSSEEPSLLNSSVTKGNRPRRRPDHRPGPHGADARVSDKLEDQLFLLSENGNELTPWNAKPGPRLDTTNMHAGTPKSKVQYQVATASNRNCTAYSQLGPFSRFLNQMVIWGQAFI